MPACNFNDLSAPPCKPCKYMFARYCENLEGAPCFKCLRGIAHACYADEKEQAPVTAKMLAEYTEAKEKAEKEVVAAVAAAMKKKEAAAARKAADEAAAKKRTEEVAAAITAAKKEREEETAATAVKRKENTRNEKKILEIEKKENSKREKKEGVEVKKDKKEDLKAVTPTTYEDDGIICLDNFAESSDKSKNNLNVRVGLKLGVKSNDVSPNSNILVASNKEKSYDAYKVLQVYPTGARFKCAKYRRLDQDGRILNREDETNENVYIVGKAQSVMMEKKTSADVGEVVAGDENKENDDMATANSSKAVACVGGESDFCHRYLSWAEVESLMWNWRRHGVERWPRMLVGRSPLNRFLNPSKENGEGLKIFAKKSLESGETFNRFDKKSQENGETFSRLDDQGNGESFNRFYKKSQANGGKRKQDVKEKRKIRSKMSRKERSKTSRKRLGKRPRKGEIQKQLNQY